MRRACWGIKRTRLPQRQICRGKPSVPRVTSGPGALMHRHSSRRHTKRRTSNNGMISRLALQFPLIRTSFFAVYRAFARYMKIVKTAEAEVRRKSLVGMHHPTATVTSTSFQKQTTESKIDTQTRQRRSEGSDRYSTGRGGRRGRHRRGERDRG